MTSSPVYTCNNFEVRVMVRAFPLTPTRRLPLKMARHRGTKRPREDWSCPLCTLINGWRDLRCAACDHARPDEDSPEDEKTADDVRAQADDLPQRPPGVFFMSNGTSMAWMREPRLRVNRKRPLAPSTAVAVMSPVRAPLQRGGSEFNRDVKPAQWKLEESAAPNTHGLSESASMKGDDENVCDQSEQTEGVPDAPTFNLLGFETPPPTQDLEEEEPHVKAPPDDAPPFAPSFNLLGAPTIDLTEGAHGDETSEKPSVDSKAMLAQAGLRLSDSESEDEEVTRPRNKLRRGDRAPTPVKHVSRVETLPDPSAPRWECHICTEMNDPDIERCVLCDSRRERNVSNEGPREHVSTKMISCSVCTNMNPDNLVRCELCETPLNLTRALVDAPPLNLSTSSTMVQCPTCTNENPSGSVRCELCEQLLGAATAVTCVVCTHVNPGHLQNCELCESKLPNSVGSSEVHIDLATSQPENVRPARERSYSYGHDDGEAEYDPRTGDAIYTDYDDDFENPYASFPASPVRLSPRSSHARTNALETAEDISDHEMYGSTPSESRPPPKSKRPELQEFDHFRSVEDSRQDYQCQIDYRSMFAESGCSRSYADRLQKRRRESQKRKRAQAEKDRLGGADESTVSAASTRGRSGGKKTKAAKAPGGKKAKAPSRRASTGRPSQKRPKAQASSARRSSAPSAFDVGSTNINHYDLSGGDFRDDVATMAWEGVGSAGYY